MVDGGAEEEVGDAKCSEDVNENKGDRKQRPTFRIKQTPT